MLYEQEIWLMVDGLGNAAVGLSQVDAVDAWDNLGVPAPITLRTIHMLTQVEVLPPTEVKIMVPHREGGVEVKVG